MEYDLSEASLGLARVDALVRRDRIVHDVDCPNCGKIDDTEFWLAVLGWTPDAFYVEAYPEFFEGHRGRR